MKRSNQLRYFFRFFKPHVKLIIISGICILIGVFLKLPFPLVTRYIIDKILPEQNHAILNLIILGLSCFLIVQVIFEILTSYLSSLFREKVINNFQHNFFEHLLNIEISFFNNYKTGYLLARIESDISSIRTLLADNFIFLIKDCLIFITGLIFILFFHWKLALLSIVVLPFFIISLKIFSKRMRSIAGDVQEKRANVTASLQESISAPLEIKAFQLEEREKDKLSKKQHDRLIVIVKSNLIFTLSKSITAFIGAVGPLLVLWYGGHEVINKNLSLGTLIAFNSFLAYIFGPSRRFMALNEQVQRAFASLDRIFEIFSIPNEFESDNKKKNVENIKGKVEFRGVNFSYDGAKEILKEINFVVKPGETVAVVGANGEGKSSLVNLIPRFYKHRTGTILIDDLDIEEIDLKSLRRLISIVPQDVFLFSGTLNENIRCGNEKADEDDIAKIAKLSGIDESENKLQNGLETIVGERGSKISGGQKQRVAFARALLKNAKILILDEATSEIDSISDKLMLNAINKFGEEKTVFVIAHRHSIVKDVDKILFLQNGRIAAEGKHDELYEHCPAYRELYDSQFDHSSLSGSDRNKDITKRDKILIKE
jgi:ABC-type bacteriocin/lantibiotic exporter with double-glycine peptidase domain